MECRVWDLALGIYRAGYRAYPSTPKVSSLGDAPRNPTAAAEFTGTSTVSLHSVVYILHIHTYISLCKK